jgi:plasmid stabilization system protein ParE
MDYQVLITDSALADLREIIEFVAQDDPQAAARLDETAAELMARCL